MTNRQTKISPLSALLLTITLTLVITFHVHGAEETSALLGVGSTAGDADTNTDPLTTNCRYGVGTLEGEANSLDWLPTVGAGWTVNFESRPPELPSSEFVATLRLRQDRNEGIRLPTYTFEPPLTTHLTNQSSVEKLAKANPGMLWLVGNEIEIDNSLQDNIMPDVYASAYHDAYMLIKSVDPTARVAIGSVTMATPGRLQYLDIVWDTYQQRYGSNLPVDVWNFHLYILAERNSGNNHASGKIALGTDPNIAIYTSHDVVERCPLPNLPDTPANDPRLDTYCRAERDSLRIYEEQVIAMRQWMKDHGLQDKPLIITEYGSLSDYAPGPDEPTKCGKARPDEFDRCMFPERVSQYLEGTSRFLNETIDPELGYPRDDYRLVQRWVWYSLYTPFRIGGSSNLLVEDYTSYPAGSRDALSLVGRTFRREALSPDARPNLVAGQGSSTTIYVDMLDDQAQATIAAPFRNSGDLSVVEPFAVSFYSDAAFTKRIGTTLVVPQDEGAIMGCNWDQDDGRSAELVWENLPVGTHHYWARIDETDEIDETAENDNIVINGSVTVRSRQEFGNQMFVPIMRGQ